MWAYVFGISKKKRKKRRKIVVMEKKNEEKLWTRVCGCLITITLVALIEVALGSIAFMIAAIVLKKVCELFGFTLVVGSSVVAFIFGFVAGNAIFLPTLVFSKVGKWPEKVGKNKKNLKAE